MERLTDEDGICMNCHYIDACNNDCPQKRWYDKLKAYEDAEEQGLLLRLPCKVGDTVWIKGDRFPAEVLATSLDEEGLFFEYVEYDRGYEITEVWDSGNFSADDIGKTVFLTRAEAEKALTEMK